MRFMVGIVIAGIIVLLANGVFVYLATHGNDTLDPTYETEAR